MTKELNIIVKSVAKNDLISGIILFLILVLLGQYKIGAILLVGSIVSMINFVVSAIVTNKFLNKQVEVLIEEDKDGYSYGHTSNYLHVKINKKLKHNTFVTVTITKVDYPYCLAK